MKNIIRLSAVLLAVLTLASCFIFNVSAYEKDIKVQIETQLQQTEADKALDLVNDFRCGNEAWYWNESDTQKVTCGNIEKLQYDSLLEKMAIKRAAEIALSFSHTRPDGSICFSIFDEFEFNYYDCGENIAAGVSTAEEAVKLWREDNKNYDEQGHRRNMLDANFNASAIGHVVYNHTHYWVQLFAQSDYCRNYGRVEDENRYKVDINIDKSMIESISENPEKKSIKAVLKKEIEIPNIEIALKIKDNWPGAECIVYALSPKYEVVNSDIASIKDNKIYGERIGSTRLSVTAVGKTFYVDLNVICEHNYSLVSQKDSTCTEDGFKTYQCSICADSYTKTVEKKGHSMAHILQRNPSCTSKGRKEYWACQRCKTMFFDKSGSQKVNSTSELEIPMAEHKYKLIEERKPTCTLSGEQRYKCSVCNDTYTKTVPAAGHKMIHYPEVKATCEHDGETEHWYCSACQKYFLDKNASASVVKRDLIIKKIPHTLEAYGSNITATEFISGSTEGIKCSVCGEVLEKVTYHNKKPIGSVKLKKGKKRFTASWKKVAQASGYQLKYSTGKSFKKSKVKTSQRTSCTVKKLKSGKTYYAKFRAYKSVNGKKLYSNWSAYKKVRVR